MQRFFGKGMWLGLVATMALSSSFLGCGGDDDEIPPTQPAVTTKKPQNLNNTKIQLDANGAAANNTAVLNNQTFTVPTTVLSQNATPDALKTALAGNNSTSITFTNVNGATGNFTTTNPTGGGTVRIASCTLNFTTPAIGTVFIKDCALVINATNVTPGGAVVKGTITLSLNGTLSAPVTADISILADGTVVINGHTTKLKVTGVTGG